MVDFALQDRRSISAMPRGRGDDRELKWIEFSEKKHRFFSAEELYLLYQKHCEWERIAAAEIEFLQEGVDCGGRAASRRFLGCGLAI